MSKSISICTGPELHLDHLGVFSAQYSIPMLVTDEKTHALAKRYYPGLDIRLVDFTDLSVPFLASFDAIFHSDKFWSMELSNLFDCFSNKKPRLIYCPHGNSDKGHSHQVHPKQDIALLYGEHMRQHLEKSGALSHIQKHFIIGNFRHEYYLKNQTVLDQMAHAEVFSKLPKRQRTILYAPTWQDRENKSSFFTLCSQLIEELPDNCSLIIKLHPLIENREPSLTHELLGKYDKHPGVLFLHDFPLIYPLLAGCDLYIGDYSSIGYDFLTFDKPLYFFDTQPHSALHQCGLELPKKGIFSFIKQTLEHDLSNHRQALAQKVFGVNSFSFLNF